MKKQIMLSLLLMVVVIGLVGCTTAPRVGLAAPGLTKEQVHQRHYEAIRTDLWQIQDDIDAFFLFDRPGRMHRLSVR